MTCLSASELIQPAFYLVHILSGDLILHKRTLDPIKTMIFALRRYDVDRCAALIDMSDPANKDVKIVGYMSHKAKIYLVSISQILTPRAETLMLEL